MNKEGIEKWLKDYTILHYTIHPDLVVDVAGDLDLSRGCLTVLPFQFGEVSGNFTCYMNSLTSLKNCPWSVGGNFDCSINDLTSLEYCPQTVGGEFDCSFNKLTSLEYYPQTVGGKVCYYDNNFKFTPCNIYSWTRAISLSKDVYGLIPKTMRTPEMVQMQKMLWEL